VRTQHAPSNPSLKSQTVQTDASSIGRVTGGNLTLFFFVYWRQHKKRCDGRKSKKKQMHFTIKEVVTCGETSRV